MERELTLKESAMLWVAQADRVPVFLRCLMVAGTDVATYALERTLWPLPPPEQHLHAIVAAHNAHLDHAEREPRLAVVTGSNTGIGFETARALLLAGYRTVLACRNMPLAEQAAAKLRTLANVPHDMVCPMHLDLSSLASVGSFAERLNKTLKRSDGSDPQLHLLVCNAGVMNTPLFETPDGFELQWGTNHIGHFQLVRLLRPSLVRGSRVVVLSSCASNVVSAIDYAALSPDHTTYNRYRAYGHSKLANLIFAKALARRVKADGVAVYAPHPGAVATNLFRHDALTAMLMPVGSFLFRTPLEGALTPIMCALSPEVAAETGYYYADRMRFASHPVADDIAVQDDLWSYTEQVIDAALCR